VLCILLVEQFLFHKLWILEAAAHPKAAAAPAHQVLLYVAACFMIKQFLCQLFGIQEFLLEAATSAPSHPEEAKALCCFEFNVCKIKANRFVFSLPFSLTSRYLSCAGGSTTSIRIQGAALLHFF
jgi:hypothetical protein